MTSGALNCVAMQAYDQRLDERIGDLAPMENR